jgi:acyl carrier protein
MLQDYFKSGVYVYMNQKIKKNNTYIKENDMLEKIKPIIADQLGVEESEITLESSFNKDLGTDSLDLFEMVMEFEDEFDIEIPTEDLESMDTVGDIVNYLQGKGIE